MSISRTKNIAQVDNVIKEYLLQFHFNLKKNNLKETIKLLMIVFSINQSEFLQMKQQNHKQKILNKQQMIRNNQMINNLLHNLLKLHEMLKQMVTFYIIPKIKK